MKKLQLLIIAFLFSLLICTFINMPTEAQTVTLSHFVFSSISSPQTSGKAFSITITAKAANGNTITSYKGTNTLTVSSGTISPTNTGAFTAGIWTGQIILTKAETGISISTSGEGKTGKSNTFTVNPGGIDHFVFNNITSQTAESAFSITITAKDSNENTITSYSGTNTLSDSSGTINPTSTGKFSSGIWTGSVTITKPGSGITIGTIGSTRFGRSNAFNVNAISLDHFVFNAISNPRTAGSAFSITITAKAANGNTVTSYTGRPTLSTSTGTITPTITSPFSNGVWTGTVTLMRSGLGTTITATDSTHSGTSNSFTVNPADATSLEVTCSPSQVAGVPFSVTVTAKDQYGNTATNYSGRIHFTSTDQGSTVKLPTDYKFQNGDIGTHTFTNGITLMTARTGVSITATDIANNAITGSQKDIAVARAATVANIVISPSNPSITAGSPTIFSALAFDAYGNTWDVTTLMSWSISPAAGGLWNNNTYTSAAAGSWTVIAIYGSTEYTTTLTVNAARIDHFIFNTIAPQTAGIAFTITITAKDQFNNTITNYNGTLSLTFSAGSISPSFTNGSFSSGVWAGTVNVTGWGIGVSIKATDGSQTGTSNLFTSNPTITATVENGGNITPTGNVEVNYGSNQSFKITATTGYHIANVIVDNVSMGPVSVYNFTTVQATHTITACFAIDTFNISASANPGGYITPQGLVSLNYGDNQTFNISTAANYYIVDVLINGSSIGAVNSYTFTTVQASNSISVTFAQNPTPTPTPSDTSNPTPTYTSSPTPSPTPKLSPIPTPPPTPNATTIHVTTESGETVNLTTTGNITISQISNVTITSNQTTKTTTLSFTITGPNATTGFSNITIPKTAIIQGTSPTVIIDDQQTPNQGYTQDADNFYVWYTTQFSSHKMKIQFIMPTNLQESSFASLFAIGITVPEIILIYTLIAIKRLRRKPEQQ
jgi:hypothetical protein